MLAFAWGGPFFPKSGEQKARLASSHSEATLRGDTKSPLRCRRGKVPILRLRRNAQFSCCSYNKILLLHPDRYLN